MTIYSLSPFEDGTLCYPYGPYPSPMSDIEVIFVDNMFEVYRQKVFDWLIETFGKGYDKTIVKEIISSEMYERIEYYLNDTFSNTLNESKYIELNKKFTEKYGFHLNPDKYVFMTIFLWIISEDVYVQSINNAFKNKYPAHNEDSEDLSYEDTMVIDELIGLEDMRQKLEL